MKKFLRFIAAVLAFEVFLAFLLVTTIRFQILSTNFWIENLRKEGVYGQVGKALKVSLRQQLRKNYEEETGVGLESLTVRERSRLEEEINKITNIITTERLQDFSENNIVQILAFVNGQEEKLYLYLPLSKWELPSIYLQRIPPNLFTERTEVNELIDNLGGDVGNTKELLANIGGLGLIVNKIWIYLTVAIFVLLFLYYLLGSILERVKSLGILLIKISIFSLALSGFLKVISNYFASGSFYWREATQIFVGAIAPTIISDIIKLWLIISTGVLLVGVFAVVLHYAIARSRFKNYFVQPGRIGIMFSRKRQSK